MTLVLTNTNPPNIQVKTWGKEIGFEANVICFNEHTISFTDFVNVIWYFFTNSDLQENDPRLALLEKLKKLEMIPGWGSDSNSTSKRLGIRGQTDNDPFGPP